MANRMTLVATAILLAFACTGVQADDGKKTRSSNLSDSPAQESEATSAISLLALSDELAAVAIDRRDAAMLVQAARLKASVPTQDVERASQSGGGEEGDKTETGDFSVKGLLARAQVFAHGNEAALAMVGEAQAETATGTRGRRGGPGVSNDRVYAHDTDVYRLTFNGDESARIWLAGDGDTDLDLFVYDENGNLICSSVSYSDRESCHWTPSWTGSFRVEIENHGSVWNGYRLSTN